MKIVIIGGGPGGYVAAIRAAQLGACVTLIEKDKVGGTCLNRGCIPTKVLLHTSVEMENVNKEFKEIGIDITGAEINWNQLQKRKGKIVKKLVGGVEGLLKSNKVTKIVGEGSFKSKNQIVVKNQGEETIVDFDNKDEFDLEKELEAKFDQLFGKIEAEEKADEKVENKTEDKTEDKAKKE